MKIIDSRVSTCILQYILTNFITSQNQVYFFQFATVQYSNSTTCFPYAVIQCIRRVQSPVLHRLRRRKNLPRKWSKHCRFAIKCDDQCREIIRGMTAIKIWPANRLWSRCRRCLKRVAAVRIVVLR